MKTRLITGAVYLAILLPLVIINNSLTRRLYTILTMFVCFYGTFEIVRAGANQNKQKEELSNINVMKYIVPILSSVFGLLSCYITHIFTHTGVIGASYYIFIFLYYLFAMFVVLCALVLIPNTTIKDFGTCMLGLTYGGLLMSIAFSVRFLEPANINNYINLNGTKSFLFVYTIIVLTDSFAMIFGCKYGKHRLAPSISPLKSVEGAIAGLVGGLLFGIVGLFVYGIINYEIGKIIIVLLITAVISILISASGQFGDLIESKFKRNYEIKDMGKILPGHGGILDRFDSFISAGVVFYIVVIVIEILMIG